MPVSIQCTLHTILSGNKTRSKHTCQYRTNYTTHSMHSKSVEGIIVFKPRLYSGNHEKAYRGGNDADTQCARQINRAGCGSDSHKSGHSSCTRADNGRLLIAKPIGRQPTSGIESEPAQPQERSSHKNESHVVWRNGVSHPVIHSLAKHDSHNQCGNSGVNMHHRTSGKVDSTHFLQESSTPHPMGHREISYNHPQNGP